MKRAKPLESFPFIATGEQGSVVCRPRSDATLRDVVKAACLLGLELHLPEMTPATKPRRKTAKRTKGRQ